MNCRPGDLAVIVRSACGNEGKLVTVQSWEGDYMYQKGDIWPSWNVRLQQQSRASDGSLWREGEVVRMPDAWLRPIRPNGVSDEEVRDLYLPKVPEHA